MKQGPLPGQSNRELDTGGWRDRVDSLTHQPSRPEPSDAIARRSENHKQHCDSSGGGEPSKFLCIVSTSWERKPLELWMNPKL